MKKLTFKSLLAIIFLIITFSCSKDSINESKSMKLGFIVEDNSFELDKRVINKDEVLTLSSVNNKIKSSSSDTLTFTLRAEILPPVYNGDTLQASHVIIKDMFAFVTYNTQGEVYRGGLEVFDVCDIENPKLLWSAILPEGDISSVDYKDGKLYLAGAYNMDYNIYNIERPAFLDVLNLDSKMLLDTRDTVISLQSYVGTDVKVSSNQIYATSGSDGYFKVFDFDYNEIYSENLIEARSVDFDSKYVFVLLGQPGLVKRYCRVDYVLNKYSDIQTGGAEIPESKSEIVATSSNCFIVAVNEGGVLGKTFSGSNWFSIDKPATPVNKDPNLYVSNSISVNNKILFIANGGAGIGVAKLKDGNANMLGSLMFGEGTSTNFVESDGKILFVATGNGGLKIVEMSN